MSKAERDKRYDVKRRTENPNRKLYDTKRWKQIRAHQLRAFPLCAMCLKARKYTPATVVDHVERHDYDPVKFWTGALQSLCAHHHNSAKHSQEMLGYSNEIDQETGLPSDPRHPFNR